MNAELLKILACPACKQNLTAGADLLICTNLACGLCYPIRDGIPVLLIDEARKKTCD